MRIGVSDMRVTVRGVIYPTISDTGYSERHVHRHLATHGHLDFLGKPPPVKRPDRHREVNIFGITFESVTAAANYFNVDRKTIRNAENGKRAAVETIMRRAWEKNT